jgi:cell division protease FtsH
VELFVGRGASRIRDLFAEARKRAPAVVFIDELDAVGGKRGIGINEERDQTLNQLLTELDGFEGRPGVLLLAATNRAEVLDSALTRPGRLSRKVIVPLPDLQGRAEILGVHLRNIPMASPSEKQNAAVQIARITRGFSGAELANVVNEAALLAGRHNANIIQLAELVEGVNRTRFGINGGNAALTPVRGLQQKLQNWLIDSMSSSKHVKASPMGS